MTPRKIVTSNVCPPIPWRKFDWCAYLDGDEEGGIRGWGETEAIAIADLEWQQDEEAEDEPLP